MRNWLIKLLGGYTKNCLIPVTIIGANEALWLRFTIEDMAKELTRRSSECASLERRLKEALKNDHRDAKGRFTKGKYDV